MSAENEMPPAWAQKILERLDRIERSPLMRDRIVVETENDRLERLWHETKAITEIADVKERAKKIAALGPKEALRCWQHFSGDDGVLRAAETLSAVPNKDRQRVEMAIPEEFRLAMHASTLPLVDRVRVFPTDDTKFLETSPIRGARRSDDIPAFKFCGPHYRGTEAGVTERYFPREIWEGLLGLVPELAAHVASGALTVEKVSDEQSRRLMIEDVRQSHRDKRNGGAS